MSACSVIRLNHLRRMVARSLAVSAAHFGNAASAASIAFAQSPADRSATVSTTCPDAGLITSKVAPDDALTHSPLINDNGWYNDIFNSLKTHNLTNRLAFRQPLHRRINLS